MTAETYSAQHARIADKIFELADKMFALGDKDPATAASAATAVAVLIAATMIVEAIDQASDILIDAIRENDEDSVVAALKKIKVAIREGD